MREASEGSAPSKKWPAGKTKQLSSCISRDNRKRTSFSNRLLIYPSTPRPLTFNNRIALDTRTQTPEAEDVLGMSLTHFPAEIHLESFDSLGHGFSCRDALAPFIDTGSDSPGANECGSPGCGARITPRHPQLQIFYKNKLCENGSDETRRPEELLRAELLTAD